VSNGVTARDGYERYYAEKLWQLVPEVYRNEDAAGQFRQIVELIAEEAAESRRSIDRLWEDQHIETCDDWAVPYIGALVNARLVSAEDRRARRVDVGNTIRFRRRRGTPDLLDTLVRAMSGWDTVLEEGFRRLARTRHRLDPLPRDNGLFTATLSGGFADLRNPAGAELNDSPFDEYFHTLDTRLLRGRDGRFGPRKLNFHLYRLRAFEMTGVDPVELTDPGGLGFLRTYTVDPSGRDIPLFINGEGAGDDEKTNITRQNPICVDPLEWQISQPMRCRLLCHDAYQIASSHILTLQQVLNPPLPSDVDALGRLRGVRFKSEPEMRRRLQDFGAAIGANPPDWYIELVTLSLIEQTGKSQLYPEQVAIDANGAPVPTERISAANLSNLLCHPIPAGGLALVVISPEQGRFASSPVDQPPDFAPHVARYYYGFSAGLGAGPYPRPDFGVTPSRVAADGVVPDGGELQGDGLLISDNRSYELIIHTGQTVSDDGALTVGPQRRPFVRLRGPDGSLTTPTLRPSLTQCTFTIDGGWYAGQDPNGELGPGDTFDLVIDGAVGNTENEFDFDRIEIRYATLDPGGVRADGVVIPPLRLFVRSRVKTLVIRNSITGPIIVEKEDTDDPSVIDELIICESIVDGSQSSAGIAVSNLFGRVSLEASTVFGDLRAAVLSASHSIVDGRIRVVNNQAGCFRFSATNAGDDVRLPPRYRDFVGRIPPAFFNSSRFGDPQYAQLSVVAPAAIREGAENGSEMGAFSHLLNPIRLRSVRAKVDEYGPAGQLAQYLFEGDRAAESLFLLGPISPDPQPPPPPDPGEVIPQPDPPPPPPLPTTCGDEEPDPEPEPDPEQPVIVDTVLIPLVNADLNGAPDFWSGVDWLPAANEAIDPSAPALPGIPLDKVDHLIEYDARFGTRPEEQGWQPANPETPPFYTLEEDSLRFNISAQAPAFYSRAVPLPTGNRPEQVHAYAVVSMRQAPARAAEDPGESFELAWVATALPEPAAGMRAGWSRTAGGALFRYLKLDGSGERETSSREPHDRLLNAWMQVSLQADLKDNFALMSLGGSPDREPLDWFGKGLNQPDAATFDAWFGFTRKSGRAEGRLRNFVVSAPGRFLRVWLRSVAPTDEPVLRLAFVVDGVAEGSARIVVRYSDDPDRHPSVPPAARVESTLELEPADEQRIVTLDLPLDRARKGHHLLMTVERDWTHPEDKLRSAVRLVSAQLLVMRGR
jgi:hypothetical protein